MRGVLDVPSLPRQVRTFVKNEDQNFSLFNYVNEQQNEVEKLEEQLHQLEEEEQKFTQVKQMDLWPDIPHGVHETYEYHT